MEHTYPTAADLAETIRRALTAAKLSQRELAEAAGIAPSTLNRRIAGDSFTWDELRAVSRVLGRSASSVIAETEVRAEASQVAA